MDWSVLAIYVCACVAAGATGSLYPPGAWWKSIKKPWFTPPDWVFPVAWTTIYAMSAVAATRISGETGNGFAQALWALQIALNTLWSPIFFGLHRIRVSLVVVTALWLTVFATVIHFWQLDLLSGLLMAPYLIWLTVASALNGAVIILNPKEGRGGAPTAAE